MPNIEKNLANKAKSARNCLYKVKLTSISFINGFYEDILAEIASMMEKVKPDEPGHGEGQELPPDIADEIDLHLDALFSDSSSQDDPKVSRDDLDVRHINHLTFLGFSKVDDDQIYKMIEADVFPSNVSRETQYKANVKNLTGAITKLNNIGDLLRSHATSHHSIILNKVTDNILVLERLRSIQKAGKALYGL